MAGYSVKVEGLSELQGALRELGKATGRNVLRRVLTKRAQPLADAMRAKAPDDPQTQGKDLKNSIAVGSKLSRRQAGQHRRETRNDKAFAEVFVGPGPDPAAVQQEFGNINHGPQPFGRPAWDEQQGGLLPGISDDLWTEIQKAADRKAKRAARKAAKG